MKDISEVAASQVKTGAAKSERRITRQVRIATQPDEAYFLRIGDEEFAVLDYSLYGISVSSPRPLEMKESLSFVPFMHKSKLIGEYELEKVRSEKMSPDSYKTAFRICADEIPIEKIQALQVAARLEKTHRERVMDLGRIPHEFKSMVYEIKSMLLKLKADMDREEASLKFISLDEQALYHDVISERVGGILGDYFTPIYGKFADEVMARYTKDEISACFKFFQSELFELIRESRFAERSIEKPRGYAGDYDMMNLLYHNEPIGRSLFAKALHQYYLSHPNAKAVRNRSIYLYHHLRRLIEQTKKGDTIRILVLASGPAKELQLFIEKYHNEISERNFEVTLCDLDTDALLYSQRQLNKLVNQTNCKIKVEYHKQNILKLRKEGVAGNMTDRYDFIYSAGVFDYIKDTAAAVIVEYLYERLAHGGKIVIGNFTLDKACAALMDLALDWNLLYRTKKELKEMFDFIDPQVEIEHEEEGINLFAILRKK